MQTKIIATIGPASEKLQVIKNLKKAGVNIGRINMKYSTLKKYREIQTKLSQAKCKTLIDIQLDQLAKIANLTFDYLALSFTENAHQIQHIRKFFNSKKIFIIAKIETKKSIENINQIINHADGIMVARGDLGKHIPIKKLPFFQKQIIKKCNQKEKFVITATEMLLSMTNSKIPTRAEVTDVANAIIDGSNALMLSEETAIGKYPIIATKMMRDIIDETLRSQ
jgi:pyruvate kinase